jgi:hypothetical protein
MSLKKRRISTIVLVILAISFALAITASASDYLVYNVDSDKSGTWMFSYVGTNKFETINWGFDKGNIFTGDSISTAVTSYNYAAGDTVQAQCDMQTSITPVWGHNYYSSQGLVNRYSSSCSVQALAGEATDHTQHKAICYFNGSTYTDTLRGNTQYPN